MNKFLDQLKKIGIPTLIIGVLFTVVNIMRMCEGPATTLEKPTVVTKTDTTYIHKIIHDTIYTPPITHYIYVPQQVPAKVDTQAILKDYFTKKVYEDTIKIDSIGYVVVKDTLFKNQILTRETKGTYSYPVITKTTTITLPPVYRNQLYVGLQLNGPVVGLGPQLILKTKGDKLFQLGASLSPSGINYNLGLGWKIKLRK
jgi:hypothetical protein